MTIAGAPAPGTTVATCSLLIHRRPDVFEDPLAWRVDRFLGTRPPAGAWLPFGGGVRRCVGAAFAQFEARIVLDELLRAVAAEPREPAGRAAGPARDRARARARAPRGPRPEVARPAACELS